MVQKHQLEGVLKLKDNASPLPWKVGECRDGMYHDKMAIIREDPLARGSREFGKEIFGPRQLGYPQVNNVEENAAYVVAACNILPDLASDYLKLLELVEKVVKVAVSTGYYVTESRRDHVFYEIDKQVFDELKQFLVNTTPIIDVLTMPAGRELDKLVAKLIFGMTDESVEEGASKVFYNMRDRSRGAGMIGNEVYEKDCEEWRKEKFRDMQIPHYSTDIAAAFTIPPVMRGHGYVYEMGDLQESLGVRVRSCRFFKMGRGNVTPVRAETEQAAICRAALYAILFADKE